MVERTGNQLLTMSVVPDGAPAWLWYWQYKELKRLVDAALIGGETATYDPAAIAKLRHFITATAKLPLPDDAGDEAVWFNGYALMSRGYKVETLLESEYRELKALYLQAEPTEPDDMDLHETGTHRALYNMLTRTLGLDVEAGRGPVWRRAMRLLNYNGPRFEPEPA